MSDFPKNDDERAIWLAAYANPAEGVAVRNAHLYAASRVEQFRLAFPNGMPRPVVTPRSDDECVEVRADGCRLTPSAIAAAILARFETTISRETRCVIAGRFQEVIQSERADADRRVEEAYSKGRQSVYAEEAFDDAAG